MQKWRVQQPCKNQLVFCNACQHVFCNRRNGKALPQFCVSPKVLRLAALMCNCTDNGGIFLGLRYLVINFQALVLFGRHNQSQGVSMFAENAGLMHVHAEQQSHAWTCFVHVQAECHKYRAGR